MIPITPFLAIDGNSISETFVRASGPGGQKVNKVATAVRLRFNPAASGLSKDIQDRLRTLGGRRVTSGGEVLITSQRFRTQERNRQAALDALITLIRRALSPVVPRTPTRPTLAARRRRLQSKAHRARIKQGRSAPPSDE